MRDKKLAAQVSSFEAFPSDKYPTLFAFIGVPTAGHTAAELADILVNFGYIRRTQGDSKEAETLFREALALAPKLPSDEPFVVGLTRSGTILAYATGAPACSPSSWPQFHHDPANSGDYQRDAVDPGAPYGASFSKGVLTFRAPGDDLMCGKVDHYEVVESNSALTGANFDQGFPVPAALRTCSKGRKGGGGGSGTHHNHSGQGEEDTPAR